MITTDATELGTYVYDGMTELITERGLTRNANEIVHMYLCVAQLSKYAVHLVLAIIAIERM